MKISQVWGKWEDWKATTEYFKDLLNEVGKGIKAYTELGCGLFIIRPMKQYGNWGNFLNSIGLKSTKDLNCRHFAQDFMVNAGIIFKGQYPKKEDCIKALELLASNSAFMQNCLDNIDVNGIRRQNKSSMRRKTGSIVGLEPQFSRLMDNAKNRAQYCYRWDLPEVCDWLNLLDRFRTDSGALSDHIINSWLDEELKKGNRHVTLEDLELEPADMVD